MFDLMKLFDSHCHLDDRIYATDLDAVFKRARKVNVKAMMIVGINYKSSCKALRLAESQIGLFSSAGIHPHDVVNASESILEQLCVLTKNPKIKAFGEIGLDFNRMFSPRKIQEKWFARQLETAQHINLPVIIHERDSQGRVLEILQACLPPAEDNGVIHCFSGTQEQLKAYLDLGLYIGITGVITHQVRGEYLRRLVPFIPADRLLIETDAPWLTPAPRRNRCRRNEPAFIKDVLLKLAEVRKVNAEILADTLWHNTCKLFKIIEDNFGFDQ